MMPVQPLQRIRGLGASVSGIRRRIGDASGAKEPDLGAKPIRR